MGVLMEDSHDAARLFAPFITTNNGLTVVSRETSFDKTVEPLKCVSAAPREGSSTTAAATSKAAPPPKKKWIKEYLEEEPPAPAVSVSLVPLSLPRTNGVVVTRPNPLPAASHAAPPLQPDTFEHSRPRTNSTNSHGGSTASPPAVGGPARAGTREVHNKLEKNRRAHLKECFELLKRQLPASNDDKKPSNLAILGSANRYIQVLRRKERECEHEMERLAREKIAAQQRIAALKRDLASRAVRTESVPESADCREERANSRVLSIPISITPPSTTHQNGGSGSEGSVVHLPLSQVVRGGLVVGGTALQLLSASGGLRVLQSSQRVPESSAPETSVAGVVVGGLAPLVVSQAQLLHAHKVLETQVVSAQYVSAVPTIVKPVVVVSAAAPAPPAPPTSTASPHT